MGLNLGLPGLVAVLASNYQTFFLRLAGAALATAALAAALRAAETADQACLACHGDPSLTMVRDGHNVSLYVDARGVGGSVHSDLGCAGCHDAVDASARPHHAPAAPVDCRGCHEGLAKSHAFHADFAAVPLAATPETDCAGCHGAHGILAASGAKSSFVGLKLVAACGECHAEAAEHYLKSAHGGALAAGRSEAPTCLSCHLRPVASGSDRLKLKREQSLLCLSCHRDESRVVASSVVSRSFIVSYAESVHGKSLSHGNAAAANCVDCHGSHETAGALSAGSRENLRNIPTTCARCHPAEAREYALSSHAAALRKGLPDAPVCTTCHGEHQILRPADPKAPVSARNVSQMVCGACHASVKLSERYGLATDRFQTFADSFHGLATRGGAVVAVNCASCHGANAILPFSDPKSPINRANLAQTCGQCHPGANTRFASAPVHITASARGQEPVVYWIATLYVWLIVAVVGGMFVHNGLDFLKKVRRKIGIQKGEIIEEAVPHRLYLRMTVNERLQHGTLVLSFVALVVTGFMLQFPDAWWVIHIRSRFGHLFEWRSIIHRVAGVILIAAGAWHVAYLALTKRGRLLFRDLLPHVRDLADAAGVLRYNLGLAPDKPKFGRFSYIEKTEYWAMMWGSVVMGITGALLWFENTSIRLFTGLGYDVSRTIHFYEAVLATLAIVVWHLYFVIFNPDIYPMNLSWLTGWLSEKEMREDHPLELERIEAERARAERKDGPQANDPGAR
jgi:cytochrome b subunit of formate dehydrogenase/mono/diheme cytochrome c family protein